MPKVSVLMPVYNGARWVADAIDSILRQTFADFEFIIINDGSTDNSAQIIESFNDARIRFINNPDNRGLISVLNLGLELCGGEYIARMDCDDIAMPTRLAQQVEFMDANPWVAMCATAIKMFGPKIESHIHSYEEADVHITDLVRYNPVWHPTVMMRAEFLHRFGLRYNPDCIAAEDYDMWFQILRHGGVIKNLPFVGLEYRVHGDSITGSMSQIQLNTANKIRQNVLDFLTDKIQVQNAIKSSMGHGTSYYVRLFDLIPIFKVRVKPYKTRWYLFGFLPLVAIKR